MIVSRGEVVSRLLAAGEVPIGSFVTYSSMEITDSQGVTEHRMTEGVLVGVDQEFGGRSYGIVQARDNYERPTGVPKLIHLKGLEKFVEFIEFDPDSDLAHRVV